MDLDKKYPQFENQRGEFEKQAKELLGAENFDTYDANIESAKGILSESQADQFEIRANEMKERITMNLIGEFP